MFAFAVIVLIVAPLYAAAPAVETFEYKFDTKDNLEGWTPNEASKAEVIEKGAGGSACCLKLSGKDCSVESPSISFKCNDNVISFDYFVHGAASIRLRLCVKGEENITKYGKYGNLFLRKIEPDQWLHAEIKLADVPGAAESNKAKAYPELEYRKLGIMTYCDTDDYFVQLDNIKLGKASGKTDEKPAETK